MSDIYSFRLSFWLLTCSCVVTYMSVFPYIQICSDMLQTKYSFDSVEAGHLFGIPYLISAFTSPFLGLMIDKIGRRALIIIISSVILISAFLISMLLNPCDQCYSEVYPLILVGVGYSIYAAAIWGSVPYVVTPQTVGTAFGICTAIQNIGLTIAPTIVGYIKDETGEYKWVMGFFVAINIIGFFLNVCLYFVDIYQMDGILNKVSKDDQL